jgi:hypothetical protein
VTFDDKSQLYLCQNCSREFVDKVASRRIFLSYGKDEYASLAQRLKTDLAARGYQVWFDIDQLKPGLDWEIYIEQGLDWVSEKPDIGCLVLLMTPHSVRRPDGYCLNELARATMRKLRIVPVMVASCEQPLSISRIQYLDMRDCVPIETREEKYKNKFKILCDALENDRFDFDGTHTRLLSLLEPLPFDAEILFNKQRVLFIGSELLL